MASRIWGWGMCYLILEKVEKAIDAAKAQELERKILTVVYSSDFS
jgi:signal recognition particle GTPase